MKKYVSMIASMLLCSSCGEFLKEFSQDLAYANDCKDLDEILIGNGYMEQISGFAKASVYGNGYYPYLQVMDDDVNAEIIGEGQEITVDGTRQYKHFYEWSNQLTINPTTEEEWEDTDWKRLYAHIGYLNVIISQVKSYTQDSLVVRNRVEGEARFLRGAYYYLLTNLYANPYVRATAGEDPGVPLNLTEDIEDRYYSRNSLEECYRVIVEDLKAAAEKLHGVKQPTIYRVNEAAARILLSRVYLYMGEWQAAIDECRKAQETGEIVLTDLNDFQAEGEDYERQYMLNSDNPEILFTQGSSATNTFEYGYLQYYTILTFVGSEELISLYRDASGETEDLRLKAFFSLKGDEQYIISKVPENGRIYDCFVIRAAELYLNRAEAEAMLDKTEAVTTLEPLLHRRYKGGKIPQVKGLSGEALVKWVRNERRKELCFEAQRWFDLRRYAVCPKYPERKEIKHWVYNKNAYAGVNVLKPYGEDPAWVLPLPGYEIVYNQGALVDNPERSARTPEN